MPEVDVEILHETRSLCPVCLRRLDARYVRRGQSVLLERTCPEHGTFAVAVWHERTEGGVTPPRFNGWSRPKTPSYPREPRTPVRHGCPYDCGLCPAHAQHTCTGLVEVTLRCNMACPVCYAAAGGAVPDDPSPETVAFQLDSLRRASPGCNVQLSGGEPTVRDDLPALIRMARERGFGLLQVNSNGLRLGLEAGYARKLREAGLDSVYLQWDSPDLEGCLPLRGAVALPGGLDLLAVKRRAVEQCTDAGLGVVLVATVRALKHHGGCPKDQLGVPNVDYLKAGAANLARHVENMRGFGVPVCVAINAFPTDSAEEHECLRDICADLGVPCELATVFADGGKGGLELGKAVLSILQPETTLNFTYPDEAPLAEKVDAVAKKIYRAAAVSWSAPAKKALAEIEAMGYGKLPVCIAKTQYSFSDDATLLAAPEGFTMTVRDVRLSAGAGFVVVIMGSIMTMPGLPKKPAAENIDVDENGRITGLF